ncbi:MAG: tRNA (guanosine(37)-N1)-methyltransferase TrmD [Lachnospiraceae bacterium]|nr:tRNA (guanosine(37)-N1)-methyltransferase TrmD [Lachnospiraceae bacterium]
MKFHVLTLFPEMILQGLGTSILGRATENGFISIDAVNIRDFTTNKHNRVDDYTYGGGAGMLMQAQPVYDAWKSVCVSGENGTKSGKNKKPRTIYLTPQGAPFTQHMAEEFAKEEELIFLCGHYEGIDERVLEEIVTDYVSIGDYVLTGGELPAMVMIDSIARLVPGVLNNEVSAETESFHGNLLEYPQFSRPVSWMGKEVPKVLLSGDHKKIREWRLEESIKRTKERRPDLYKLYERDQACIQMLMKDKLLHIDMIELIRRGQAQILYFEKDGVLLRDKVSGAIMMTAKTKEAAGKILEENKDKIEKYNQNQDYWMFVSHQECINEIAQEVLGLKLVMGCYQSVYTRKEMLLAVKAAIVVDGQEVPIEIRSLGMEHVETVSGHYENADMSYVQGRIAHGCMYGAFAGDVLTGFVGIHEEGSSGMLEVFPEYRKCGIGKALETFIINLQLEKGYTPFGQVKEENEVSMALQSSLGLYFSKGKVYWFEKK